MKEFQNKPRSFKFKATAIALAAATGMTLASPAFAGGRHGYGGSGHSYSHATHSPAPRSHRGAYQNNYSGGHHNSGNDDGLAAIAIVGGAILGAALLSSAAQQPAPPPQTYYAPEPAYAPSYGYTQAPVEAIPTSDIYQTASGQYCREYQSTVNVSGHLQNGYGTACQQPDGSWHIVN